MRLAGPRLALPLLLGAFAGLYCALQPLEPVPPGEETDGGGDGGDREPDSGSQDPCPTESQMPAVQSFFSRKCTNCHPGDHSPDLGSGSSRAALVNQFPTGVCGPPSSNANPGWRLVVPGDLSNSVLWRYVQDCGCGTGCLSPPCNASPRRCGSKDPICAGKGSAPSAADRAAVQCWILQGAPP